MTMPFYVAPEQVMKDRADYARKGIARGRSASSSSYADGILIAAENPSRHPAQGQRDLRPHRLRGGRQVQRVRPAAASPASGTPTSRATSSPARTSTRGAWPTRTPRSSARSSPTR